MSEQPVKQKIVDKLKDSETVLVTVSSSPSVDELSAALGFTLLLNKMNKHATAVFSGDVPPAITFLDPEKTFENTVDSLRDFIIALDKERADHLRYKVEGDMVKIFITPYRTTIDQSDFEFSQGDYNVEMVVAIGVDSEDDLDKALSEHGRILHDATVASLSVGDTKSELGTITWHDDKASSYSEMLVSIVESLKGSKNPIDEQIATAFLTGIVAATDRFSNTKTTSNAMTMAATLMAAGANQQLIATKLEEAEEIQDGTQSAPSDEEAKGETSKEGAASKDAGDSSMLKVKRDDPALAKKPAKTPAKKPKKQPKKATSASDGSMSVSHEKQGTLDQVAAQVAREDQAAATEHAEEQLANSLASSQAAASAAAKPSVADLKKDLERASEEVDDAAEQAPAASAGEGPVLPAPVAPGPAVAPDTGASTPQIGGTLNATTEQAADDKRRELEKDRNKTILSHDTGRYLDDSKQNDDTAAPKAHNQSVNMAPPKSPMQAQDSAPTHKTSQRGKTIMPPSASPAPQQAPKAQNQPSAPTLADIDAKNRGQDAARSDIEQALQQDTAAQSGQGGSLPPLPPMPDFSTLPDLPPSAQDDGPGGFIQTPLPKAQPSPQPTPQQTQPVPQSPGNAQAQQPQAPQGQAQPVPQTAPAQQPASQAAFQPPVAVGATAQQEQNLSERLGDILPPAQPQAAPPPQPQDPTQFKIPN